MTLYPPVKPHGNFALKSGEGFRILDVPRITPTHNGRIDWETYCNVTYRLKDPNRAAKIRMKMVREAWNPPGPKGYEPEDPTAYQGFWLLPGFDNFLLTHTFWEIAEAGRRCHIELRVDGADITIGTRYAKAIQ
jgi:hypothetical protein